MSKFGMSVQEGATSVSPPVLTKNMPTAGHLTYVKQPGFIRLWTLSLPMVGKNSKVVEDAGMSGMEIVEVKENVPLFPLYTVLFPGMLLPLHVFEPRYLRLMDRVLNTREELGIVLIAKGKEVGGPAIPHEVGTLGRIVRMERLENGSMHVVVQGTRRFRIREVNHQEPYLQAHVEVVREEREDSVRAYALSLKVRELWHQYSTLLREAIGLDLTPERVPDDATDLAFFVAGNLHAGLTDRQRLLIQWSVADMLAEEIRVLQREISLLRYIKRTQDAENEQRMGPTGYLSRN